MDTLHKRWFMRIKCIFKIQYTIYSSLAWTQSWVNYGAVNGLPTSCTFNAPLVSHWQWLFASLPHQDQWQSQIRCWACGTLPWLLAASRVLTCAPASGSEAGCRNPEAPTIFCCIFQSTVSVFANLLIVFTSCHSVPRHRKCFFISHLDFCERKLHFGISGPMRLTPPLTTLQRPIQIMVKYFLCQPIVWNL